MEDEDRKAALLMLVRLAYSRRPLTGSMHLQGGVWRTISMYVEEHPPKSWRFIVLDPSSGFEISVRQGYPSCRAASYALLEYCSERGIDYPIFDSDGAFRRWSGVESV